MVTHVVFIKVKNRTPEDIEKAHDLLQSMDGKVPQLRYLEVGVDLLRGQHTYDLVLLAKFDSMKDLQAYKSHPFHAEVLEELRPLCEQIAAVDYKST
ncbi:MAG: Dabb family protein [Elusimicrobiota bacterium]